MTLQALPRTSLTLPQRSFVLCQLNMRSCVFNEGSTGRLDARRPSEISAHTYIIQLHSSAILDSAYSVGKILFTCTTFLLICLSFSYQISIKIPREYYDSGMLVCNGSLVMYTEHRNDSW